MNNFKNKLKSIFFNRKFITAVALVVIVVPLIILGGWFTFLLSSLICVIGVIEIIKTCDNKEWHWAIKATIMAGSIVLFCWSILMDWLDTNEWFTLPDPYRIRINVLAILAYLIILLVLECTTRAFMMDDVFYIFTMTLFISLSCQGLLYLRTYNETVGLRTLGYIFAVTCSCDAFAQISGTLFGKHKFAPITSPKKTWEGVIGGVTIATIIGFVFMLIWPIFNVAYDYWHVRILISLAIAIGAVMGDLIFSSIKRQVHIKDFGNELPGHGGILDRFDSLLFTSIIFICILGFLEPGLVF